MKKFLVLFLGIGIMFLTMSNSSCNLEKIPASPTSDQIAQTATEDLMKEAAKQIGMPNIDKFTQKKLLKMIYELQDDENLICYAYLADEMHGQFGQYLGRCIGYGVPAATQFSNPERVDIKKWDGGTNGAGGVYGTLPQPEPNGLFMPTSTDATWLILLDKKNNPRVCYFEPHIIVLPFKWETPE